MSWREEPSVLVLEDQPLIALDIEESLNRAGFDKVVIWSSCLEAKQWLDTHSPDFAVIETCLRDGSTDEIALSLDARNIPIIVHSGAEFPPDLVERSTIANRVWIDKPCPPDVLLEAINAIGLIEHIPDKTCVKNLD